MNLESQTNMRFNYFITINPHRCMYAIFHSYIRHRIFIPSEETSQGIVFLDLLNTYIIFHLDYRPLVSGRNMELGLSKNIFFVFI